MAKPLIRTNIYLSAAEREQFSKLARKQGTSAAAIIRAVLDAYLGIKPEPVEIVFKNQPPAMSAK